MTIGIAIAIGIEIATEIEISATGLAIGLATERCRFKRWTVNFFSSGHVPRVWRVPLCTRGLLPFHENGTESGIEIVSARPGEIVAAEVAAAAVAVEAAAVTAAAVALGSVEVVGT